MLIFVCYLEKIETNFNFLVQKCEFFSAAVNHLLAGTLPEQIQFWVLNVIIIGVIGMCFKI